MLRETIIEVANSTKNDMRRNMKQWKTIMIEKKGAKSAFKHLLKRFVLPNFL